MTTKQTETRRPRLVPIDEHLDILRSQVCSDGVCNYTTVKETPSRYLSESAEGERPLQELIDEAVVNERDRKALRLFLEHLLETP